MNILFAVAFLICNIALLLHSPDDFLPALLDGAGKSATLCLSLVATYAVWMGLMRVWEVSGVSRGVSKLLRPVARRLLKTNDSQALDAVCMNMSVNMLGISGAATPYGIKAANLLDKTENADYSSAMLFVLNATSLQILPTSMVGVRVAMGSAAATDIILPTLLTTVFSTALGIFLTWLFLRPKKTSNVHVFPKTSCREKIKIKGAGTR